MSHPAQSDGRLSTDNNHGTIFLDAEDRHQFRQLLRKALRDHEIA